MADKKVFYSIVIPVYNTTEILRQLAERIDRVFRDLIKSDYEIIMVNDFSPNSLTWAVLKDLRKKNKKMKIVNLAKNCGQHPATLCGMGIAKGDYVITMDDDLQQRPEDIVSLLGQREHEIVIGAFAEKRHNLFKRITSDMKGWFDYKLIGKPKNLKLSSFRLIQRSAVENILKIQTSYPIMSALIFSVTSDVVNVEVAHENRQEGKSGYSLFKMVKLFTNLIINNSSMMLKIVGYIGLVASFLSICFAVYIVMMKLFRNHTISGWSSIMVTINFFGGLILFSLGVIGEYLIRLIYNAEQRPSYYIRSIE